jgi:hypothetical protein
MIMFRFDLRYPCLRVAMSAAAMASTGAYAQPAQAYDPAHVVHAPLSQAVTNPPRPKPHAGADRAIGPLAILSGRIVTPVLNVYKAPATPGVRFKFDAPFAAALVNFGFVSPSGQTYYAAYFAYAPNATHGTLDAQYVYLPLSPYAEAGTWTLTSARIIDYHDNEVDYDAAQLASMFPSTTMTVVNDKTSDNVAPTVSAGHILTRVVHAAKPSALFGISFTVADNLSGVSEFLFNLQAPDGSGPYTAFALGEPPVLNGSKSVYMDMTGQQPGTWTITGYQFFDVAGNTLTDNNSADVIKLLGTNKFKVVE